MPQDNEIEPQSEPKPLDTTTPPPPENDPIEPYEPPELTKFERLGKLIVSGE